MTFQTNFPLYPTKLPYITVSAKGISNGLSDIPNDGADFGPDTLYGTSSKGMYGPPYTQTTGIQEAWNYAFASATTGYPNLNNIKVNGYWMKPILLLDGIFTVNKKIFLSPSVLIANPKMIGLGSMSTYVYWDFNDNCIEIDHTNGNINYSNIEIGYLQPNAGTNVGSGTAFFVANYESGDQSYQNNVFQSYDLNFSNTFSGLAMLSLTGFEDIYLYNIQAYGGGIYGALYSNFNNSVNIFGTNANNSYVSNGHSLKIYGGNAGSGFEINNINYVYADYVGSKITVSGTLHTLHIDYVYGPSLLTTNSTTQTYINLLEIGNIISNPPFTLINSDLINIQNIIIHYYNNNITNLPTMSSTSGTTAGTVNMNFVEYRLYYKKLVITFSGYENDTTTNQTISFPLSFSSYAVISANNTGLTISTTTTGITITSPNSTTTYSGIVIVEGY